MWNFKRGVDWGTDPTGATPLPNNCFIDGLNGDDVNTGLDPLLPCKTLTKAKTNGAGNSLICAPYRYVDQFGGVGSFESFTVIGDSEDQDVVFIDSNMTRFGIGSQDCENIVISGYLQGSATVGYRIINCTFLNCANCGVNYLYGCRYVNSPLTASNSLNQILSCALINSPLTTQTGNTILRGSFVDASSTLNLVGGIVNTQAGHFENKLTWDIPAVSYDTSNTDGDPFIYDSDLLNYSFDPLNSPLFGRGYPDTLSNPRHMARYYIGTGFYSGLTSFDAKVAANQNLDVVANELLNIGNNAVEFIETDEVLLDSLQAIGVPQKVGILTYLSTVFGLNPSVGNLDRVLEIRYSETEGGVLTAYKKYRFGEQATNNGGGLGNGETGYNWGDNIPIFVKKFQVRIGVVKAGII
jgi:hypothetical protein